MVSTGAYGAFVSSVNIHRINAVQAVESILCHVCQNSWKRAYLPFQVLIFQGRLLLASADPETFSVKVQMHHTRLLGQNLPTQPISN